MKTLTLTRMVVSILLLALLLPCTLAANGLVSLSASPKQVALQAVTQAKLDIGQVELSYNYSPRINQYLRNVGVPLRSSYCMAGLYTWFKEAAQLLNAPNPIPRTGAVWQLLKHARSYNSGMQVIWPAKVYGKVEAQPGDIPCWERSGAKHRVYGASFLGHVGIVEEDKGQYVVTIEANTGPDRRVQRNGDGVYRKLREKRKIMALIRQ